MRRKYRDLGIEHLFEEAVEIIDYWLSDGATAHAIKSRDAETHYRRLRAPWVLERLATQYRAVESLARSGQKTSTREEVARTRPDLKIYKAKRK